MKAILIDPETKTISEVDYSGDYKDIYKLIDCQNFTVIQLDFFADETAESLYIDDEGLLNEPEHFFIWKDYHQPLAGKGLILGTDAEGDSRSTTLDLTYVTEMVEFPDDIVFEGFREIEPHTKRIAGKDFVAVGHQAIFGRKP